MSKFSEKRNCKAGRGKHLILCKAFICFLYYLTKKGVFLCQKLFCVIVINVDTCNEHDTTLNHTKSMHACFILGDLWRKVEDNVPFMVAYCHCHICPLSIMPTKLQ